MVAHAAIRIDAARAGTGVNTVLIQAGLIRGTVVIDDTFGPTVGRGAQHAGQAGAVTAAVARVAGRVGVRTTRVGHTGVFSYHRLNS